MMSFVKYEPKGNIAYLIIDREKALNALNSQVARRSRCRARRGGLKRDPLPDRPRRG